MATRSSEDFVSGDPGEPAVEGSPAAGVVLATRALPEPSLSTLLPEFDVRVLGYGPNEDELAAEIEDVDALITLVSDPVTERVIAKARRLKIVANYAVFRLYRREYPAEFSVFLHVVVPVIGTVGLVWFGYKSLVPLPPAPENAAPAPAVSAFRATISRKTAGSFPAARRRAS